MYLNSRTKQCLGNYKLQVLKYRKISYFVGGQKREMGDKRDKYIFQSVNIYIYIL